MAYPDISQDEQDDHKIPHQNFVTTRNLADVCQQVRSEVEAILLNENTCVYRRDTINRSLDYLSRLSPFACSMLRDVYVHLCTQQHYYWEQEKPLTWERIAMWHLAVKNILTHASPQRLRLHLICETAYSDKTLAVLWPLHSFPGLLLQLDLRLAELRQCKDNRLWDLARETALKVQAPDPNPRGTFRFLDLPAEIRQHIFSYTDLVSPDRTVYWDPERGFTAHRLLYRCGASSTAGDFCMSDYASYSSRCNCHKTDPLSLLLVSRAMHAEALDFFYANNRVVVSADAFHIQSIMFAAANQITADEISNDNHPDDMDVCSPSERTNIVVHHENGYTWTKYMVHDSARLFLDKIGPVGARLLRNLEIVFPRIGPESSLLTTDSAYSQWCSAVKYLASLRSKGDAPSLTLVLHIWSTKSDPDGRIGEPDDVPYELTADWSPREIMELRSSKTAHILDEQTPWLLEPLRAIPQLDRLFVHLEWPLHWSPQMREHDITTYHKFSLRSLAAKEAELEKLIMGAGYDSFSVGKGEELPSRWLQRLWNQGL